MTSLTKTLLTVWITAVTVFASTALYLLPRATQINVPGELAENVSALGVIVLGGLVIASFILWWVGRGKK